MDRRDLLLGKRLMRTVSFLPAALFIFLLAACAPASIGLRQEGFNLMEKGFDYQGDSPTLNKTVEISNVRVHIVGDRKLMKWKEAKNYESGVVGYSNLGNEIYLLGKLVGGKIIVNQAVLGHELMHLLNFKDPQIADPDTLDQLETCAAKSGRC